MVKRVFLLAMLLMSPFVCLAQAERSEIRQGNALFDKGDYKGAEVKYRSALQLKGDSREALSNLGGALFKQKLGDDAAGVYKKVVEQSATLAPSAVSDAHYNLGNTYLQDRKLDEAIESYKNALRLNPSDMQTKFNLAYAQKLKKDKDDKGGGQDQKQDQKQDQTQDQKQDQKQDQQQDQKDQQKQDQKPEPEKSEDRMDAERMLNAIQAAEDRTKKDVEAKREKGRPVSGSKQW